jgi:hypothetical protein
MRSIQNSGVNELKGRPLTMKSIAWILGSVVLALVLVLAIVVAIQQRDDRMLENEIERTASRLQVLGVQIADIKDARLVSMNDFIGAYAQIAPLETEYDHKLEEFRNLYVLAQETSRRTVKIPLFRTAYHPKTWKNMSEILDITSQLSDVIKRQTSVIHEMASLPQGERLRFWHEEFVPLQAQEQALRARLLVAGGQTSPVPESQ